MPSTPPVRDRDIDRKVCEAADALQQDIILARLHPRERLIEDEICARFRLKRYAARQVLAELERRGLAERPKNVGARVKSYTRQEVIDLYALREILETSAAGLIPLPVSPDRLGVLKAIQQEHDAAVARADLVQVYFANLRFHQTLLGWCDNPALSEAIDEYAQRTLAIRFASLIEARRLENARADHHRMIAMLEAGDRSGLVELCRRHLAPARDAYLALYHGPAGS